MRRSSAASWAFPLYLWFINLFALPVARAADPREERMRMTRRRQTIAQRLVEAQGCTQTLPRAHPFTNWTTR